MISDRHVELLPTGALPGFATLGRIGYQQVAHERYSHLVDWRIRRNVVIQLTLTGRGRYRSPTGPHGGGREADLGPGTALIFDTDTHRDLRYWWPAAAEPWEFIFFDVDGAAARPCIAALVAQHGHRLALDPRAPLIRALHRRLPERGGSEQRIPATEGIALAHDLLELLLVGLPSATAPADDDLALRAAAWLEDRLDQPIRIAHVAAEFGITREHLTRVFRHHLRAGPATWLRERRLGRAAQLLAEGMAVAAVAQQVGIASPAHLAHLFRHRFGLTPRQARGPGRDPAAD